MAAAIDLVDFKPARFTDSRLYTAEIDGRKWLVKVYANEQQQHRHDLERSKLLHWKAKGFPVPEVLDLALDGIFQPHVVMAYVDGAGLSDYLRNAGIAWAGKKITLDSIFGCNARRHALALQERDMLLVHTDPNTDNILLMGQGYVYIDFEHPGSIADIETAIAGEVATFTRRVLNDLGAEFTDEVVAMVLQAYRHDASLFARIETMTLARPFQFVHRFKDQRKKRKSPGLVTRYDVADALRRLRKH